MLLTVMVAVLEPADPVTVLFTDAAELVTVMVALLPPDADGVNVT